MKSRALRQSGSTVFYTIIGIVVVLIFAGTIFLVNQRAQQVRKSQEIASTATTKPVKVTRNPKNSGSESNTENSQSSSDTTDAAASTPDLPATGPENNLYSAFVVGILTIIIFEFIASRRKKVQTVSL